MQASKYVIYHSLFTLIVKFNVFDSLTNDLH